MLYKGPYVRALLFCTYSMVVLPALAAPPENADPRLAPWFQSLKMPYTGMSCCSIADCRNYPVRPAGDHYQVFYDDRWLPVPNEVVSDRTDNPTGDYVTCIQRNFWLNGQPNGPRVLCLFKAPGI